MVHALQKTNDANETETLYLAETRRYPPWARVPELGLRIGDATAPAGGGTGIDGVLSLYLKENSQKIEEPWRQDATLCDKTYTAFPVIYADMLGNI